MKKVVVAGGGVLGSQIAFQAAYKGYDTVIWLRSPSSITRTQPKLDAVYKTYLDALDALRPLCGSESQNFPHGLVDDLRTLTPEKIDELKAQATRAYENIKMELDMAKAMDHADLVIESVAEDPKAKVDFYQTMAPLLKDDAIVVTNSSTMLPSNFADLTGRPDKYLAMHFANDIYKNCMVEIMSQDKTDLAAADAAVEFAKSISMIPLRLNKEQPGYLLNSLLIPLLLSGMGLYVNEVSDPATIDAAWKLGTGAPLGPFQILDVVGLSTAENIVSHLPGADDPSSQYGKILSLLQDKISKGETGVHSGKGFYSYK